MQCYHFKQGFLQKGIPVCQDQKNGYHVRLGRKGRNSRFQNIRFFTKNPPKIENGLVTNAFPVFVRQCLHDLYRLADPNKSSSKILVAINTYLPDQSQTYWTALNGFPRQLVNTWVIGPRKELWFEDLLELRRGDIVAVGGENGLTHVLDYTLTKNPMALSYEYWRLTEDFIDCHS